MCQSNWFYYWNICCSEKSIHSGSIWSQKQCSISKLTQNWSHRFRKVLTLLDYLLQKHHSDSTLFEYTSGWMLRSPNYHLDLLWNMDSENSSRIFQNASMLNPMSFDFSQDLVWYVKAKLFVANLPYATYRICRAQKFVFVRAVVILETG